MPSADDPRWDRLYNDRRFFIQGFLWIKTKDARLVPFHLNTAQHRFFNIVEDMERLNLPVRVVALKPRRVGISTGIQGIAYHRVATRHYINGLTVAHDADASGEIFSMSRLFYDNSPAQIRPMVRFSNRKELIFENPDKEARLRNPGLMSQMRVATAGVDTLGRSKTVHILHRSELAFWPNAETTSLAVLNTVGDFPNTMIFDESTPNGIGNYFYRHYMAAQQGLSDFRAFFMAWWEFPEYTRPLRVTKNAFIDSMDDDEIEQLKAYNLTLEQVNWRRWAIVNLCGNNPDQFSQEFPKDDITCFLLSGRGRFDAKMLQRMLLKCVPPITTVNLTMSDSGRVELEENSAGFVKIWKMPIPGRSYVCGADVALGIKDGDYSCGRVRDRESLEVMAEWHGHIAPDLFGEQLFMLGRMYNQAFLGVEANNHGLTTLVKLRDMNYGRLYYRQDTEARSNRKIAKLGWWTDENSKRRRIDTLGAYLRDRETEPCKAMVQELMTYIINEDGTTDHEQGCMSDRIDADSICLEVNKMAGISRWFPSLNKAREEREEQAEQ